MTSKEKTVYDRAQATKWLSWIARGKRDNGQSVLLLEQLQPSWLASRRERNAYLLITRIVEGVLVGLIGCAIVGAFAFLKFKENVELPTIFGILGGGLFMGVWVALAVAFMDRRRLNGRGLWATINAMPMHKRVAAMVLAYFAISIVALVPVIAAAFIAREFVEVEEGQFNPYEGLLAGAALMTLLYGFILGSRNAGRTWRRDIQCVETLGLSGSSAVLGAIKGGLAGGIVGGLGVRLFGIAGDDVLFHWQSMLAIGFLGAVIGAMFDGLQGRVEGFRAEPNQGIHMSRRNSIKYGAIVGLLAGVVFVLYAQYLIKAQLNFAESLSLGAIAFLAVSLVAFLWYGGLEAVRHYTLRGIISHSDAAPKRLTAFLNYATERLRFLERVGGGYTFAHRYVEEHFADLDPDDTRAKA